MDVDDTIFDRLVKFSENDPEGFEAEKQKIIDEFINAQPEDKQERLRCKQWRMEADLAKYKDPVARMNRMVEIFWAGVKEFQTAIQTLDNPETLDEKPLEDATVLKFKKKVDSTS